MRVLDLFSGIGGFSLGLERAGPFQTVAFCEQDDFCQAVLRKHWPDVPIYDDVRTIDTDRLGRIDLICGGFPCQPWSVAGQQRGAEDDRDLWPVMASLIEKLRPRWVIGENVRGFVNEPLGLKRSLSDLEGFGYQAVPLVIPACAVDAPHRRDRVWIVAHATQLQRNGCGEHSEPRERQVSKSGKRGSADDVADADSTLAQGGRLPSGIHAQHADADSGGNAVGGETSFQWLPEPRVGRVANGISRRVDRLRALGNAVVPQVVEQIGRAILQAETCDPDTNDHAT
jgi:DNA (cytosine-5)-methyltransferase 1